MIQQLKEKKSALRKQYGYSNTNHLKSPQKKKEQIEIRIIESPHSKFTFISKINNLGEISPIYRSNQIRTKCSPASIRGRIQHSGRSEDKTMFKSGEDTSIKYKSKIRFDISQPSVSFGHSRKPTLDGTNNTFGEK